MATDQRTRPPVMSALFVSNRKRSMTVQPTTLSGGSNSKCEMRGPSADAAGISTRGVQAGNTGRGSGPAGLKRKRLELSLQPGGDGVRGSPLRRRFEARIGREQAADGGPR